MKKILGINFSYNKTLASKENYYDLAIDCRALLNIWKQCLLSLAGKVQVFKSLVVSKPVHAASMASISDSFVHEMKSLHKEFIWSNRKPKIKHTALIGDDAEGGLRCFDTIWSLCRQSRSDLVCMLENGLKLISSLQNSILRFIYWRFRGPRFAEFQQRVK